MGDCIKRFHELARSENREVTRVEVENAMNNDIDYHDLETISGINDAIYQLNKLLTSLERLKQSIIVQSKKRKGGKDDDSNKKPKSSHSKLNDPMDPSIKRYFKDSDDDDDDDDSLKFSFDDD